MLHEKFSPLTWTLTNSFFMTLSAHRQMVKHRPNFVVAHSICNEYENNPVTAEATCKNCGSRCIICDKFNEQEKEFERYPCEGCGKRQVIFKGSNTQQDFCK